MPRVLPMPIVVGVLLAIMPTPASAETAHPLLGEVEALVREAVAAGEYLPFEEREAWTDRLEQAAASERDPHTRVLLREAAVGLYTEFRGRAPQELTEAFRADARAAGDYAREVAAMEEIVRIAQISWHESENALPVYAELEALLHQAPPEVAPEYAERLVTLQAEAARYAVQYRHQFEDEFGMLDEAIRRYEVYFEHVEVNGIEDLARLSELAWAYGHRGDQEAAAQTYWQAYERSQDFDHDMFQTSWRDPTPSSLYAGYLRVTLGVDSPEYREALTHFLLEQPPDAGFERLLIGLVGRRVADREYAAAIPVLERWVEVNGDSLLAQYRLGTLLMLAGHTDEAEAVFERIRIMAGRENTFVLMAENELHAIRSGRRAGGNWWQSTLDRVINLAEAEPRERGARQPGARQPGVAPARAETVEPYVPPEPGGFGAIAPWAAGVIAVLAAVLFIAARRL